MGAYQSYAISCPKGHPYSGDNLYVDPTGRRHCKTCRRRRCREHRRRQAEAYWRERETSRA